VEENGRLCGQMSAGGGLDPDEEDYFDYYMMQGK
jgi:hypothetical protein